MIISVVERALYDNEYRSWKRFKIKKTAPLRKPGMGSFAGWSRFQNQMYGLRTPDYDCPETSGKKYKRN